MGLLMRAFFSVLWRNRASRTCLSGPAPTGCDGGNHWAAIGHIVEAGGIALTRGYQVWAACCACRAGDGRLCADKDAWLGRLVQATPHRCTL